MILKRGGLAVLALLIFGVATNGQSGCLVHFSTFAQLAKILYVVKPRVETALFLPEPKADCDKKSSKSFVSLILGGQRGRKQSYRVRRVPHNFVPLQLHGTRTIPTIPPSSDYFSPTKTVHTEYLQPVAFQTMALLYVLTVFASIMLPVTLLSRRGHRFSDYRRSASLFHTACHTLWSASVTPICDISWLILATVHCLRSIFVSLKAVSLASLRNLIGLALTLERFLQERQRQLRQVRDLNYLRTRVHRSLANEKRALKQTEVPGVPLVSHKDTGEVTYLYLPEEQVRPTRHMYDPRYFNRLARLGAGAFGMIFQVEHKITGKMMAVKQIARSQSASAEIHFEVRAMLRVHDLPWFPKVLSTFVDAEYFYVLMPYYPRGDLLGFIASSGGCLSRSVAKFCLAELLLAVHSLHKLGIIHRDLKPENILFGSDGHFIIADFGVAHLFDEEDVNDAFFADEFPLWVEKQSEGRDGFPLLTPSIDNPHTTTGVFGTIYYAAPEVMEEREYSYGVDYYSLAMIYHEMVTGYVALGCGTMQPGDTEPPVFLDLGRKDVHKQPLSMTDFSFLCKMLDPDPFRRYSSVKEIKADPVFSRIDWTKMERREIPMPPQYPVRKRVPLSHGFEYPCD